MREKEEQEKKWHAFSLEMDKIPSMSSDQTFNDEFSSLGGYFHVSNQHEEIEEAHLIRSQIVEECEKALKDLNIFVRSKRQQESEL